jgi:hypothetical protein
MNTQTNPKIARGGTSLLQEALQARYVILSTAGRHAQEAWQAIIDRKRTDITGVGHTVWVTNSQAARPDAVQSICKEHGPCHDRAGHGRHEPPSPR